MSSDSFDSLIVLFNLNPVIPYPPRYLGAHNIMYRFVSLGEAELLSIYLEALIALFMPRIFLFMLLSDVRYFLILVGVVSGGMFVIKELVSDLFIVYVPHNSNPSSINASTERMSAS